LGAEAESFLVQSSSEIPLPSPSLYSLSDLGPAAFGHMAPSTPSVGLWPLPVSCQSVQGSPAHDVHHPMEDLHSNQKPRDTDQLGSLAGAARLSQDNAGVLKQCSDGTEISRGGAGHRPC
jgi:hypothetical protein